MSRLSGKDRPSGRKFRIGEKVIIGYYAHWNGKDHFHGWDRGIVISKRDNWHYFVRSYSYERLVPVHLMKKFPTERGKWPKGG